MDRLYITFSGSAYDETTQHIVEQAPKLGADRVIIYDDRWLTEQPFYELNKAWWSRPDTKYELTNRGFGWFIWKPFLILDALDRCQPGDIVLFTDADTYPISDLSPLYKECERIGGVMLFAAQGCWHANWCKRDTFIVMGQDTQSYRDRQHAVARFMLFQKGPWIGRQLLMEWLTYNLNPLANTFDASVLAPEYPELHEPRCEQAILTNLAHKYGLKLYREACQFGETEGGAQVDRELYPQTFVQKSSCGGRDLRGSKYRNV